jgi:hypothetical protein
VRSSIQVFDKKLPVVDGHLAIVLPGDGINSAFGALLEHFGFLPENRCVGHLIAPLGSHLRIGRASRTLGDFTMG